MKVRIDIWSNITEYSVFADDSTPEFQINSFKLSSVQKEFVRSAIAIIKSYPQHLEDSSITDGIKYRIEYSLEYNSSKVLTGSNKVPDSFSELISLIRRFEPDNDKLQRNIEHEKFIISKMSIGKKDK